MDVEIVTTVTKRKLHLGCGCARRYPTVVSRHLPIKNKQFGKSSAQRLALFFLRILLDSARPLPNLHEAEAIQVCAEEHLVGYLELALLSLSSVVLRVSNLPYISRISSFQPCNFVTQSTYSPSPSTISNEGFYTTPHRLAMKFE